MSLLTLAEILKPCVRHDWAAGAFDTPNLDITQAIADAAVAEQAPVIFMVLPALVCQDQWPALVALIQSEVARRQIPAALILDHGQTLDQVQCALDLGFTGAMIDASTMPLEENIALTRQVVERAHGRGISVEAELGHVGGGQEVLDEDERHARLTPVHEAERFVRETGVDALAVAGRTCASRTCLRCTRRWPGQRKQLTCFRRRRPRKRRRGKSFNTNCGCSIRLARQDSISSEVHHEHCRHRHARHQRQ